MKKAARDMMSGLKLGPGSSHGHFEVYHDANPIREGDDKVYVGVGLEVTPCYKQFLPGLEEPEKSADAEKSEILR